MVFKRVKDFVAGRTNKTLEVFGEFTESSNLTTGNDSAYVAVTFAGLSPFLSPPSPSPISSTGTADGQVATSTITHTATPLRGIIGSGVGFGARIKAQNDENQNKKALVPVPACVNQGTVPKTPLQVSKTRTPLAEKNLNVVNTIPKVNVDHINEIELLSVLNDAYHDPSTLDILREHKFGLSAAAGSPVPPLGPNRNRTRAEIRTPFPSRIHPAIQNKNENEKGKEKENNFPPRSAILTKNKNTKGKDENKLLKRVYTTNRIVLEPPATPTPAPTGTGTRSTMTSRSYTLLYPNVRSYTRSRSQSISLALRKRDGEPAGLNEVVTASIQEVKVFEVDEKEKTETPDDSIQTENVNESKFILECGRAASDGEVGLESKASTSVEKKNASPTTTTFKDRFMTGELVKAITIIKGNVNSIAISSSSASSGSGKFHVLNTKTKARSKVKITGTSKDKLNLKAKSKGKAKAKGKTKAKKGDGLGEGFGSPLSFKCRGLDVRPSDGSSFEWLEFGVLGSGEGGEGAACLPVPAVGDGAGAGVSGERKEGDGMAMDDNDGSAKPEVSSSPPSFLSSADDAINQLHNGRDICLLDSTRRMGHESMSNIPESSFFGREIKADSGRVNGLGHIEEAEERVIGSESWVEVDHVNVGENACELHDGDDEDWIDDSQIQEGNDANDCSDTRPGTSTETQNRLSAQPNQGDIDGNCDLGPTVNDKMDAEAAECSEDVSGKMAESEEIITADSLNAQGLAAPGVRATSTALLVHQPGPSNVANSAEDVSSPAHSADTIPRTMKLEDLHFVRQLGKGASGRVYFVKDTISRSRFALKVIKKEGLGGADPEVLKLLISEQKILRENEGNPWLLQLEASWTDSLFYYMVMPFHPISLEDIIWDEIRIDSHRARFYLVELIIAIETLHARGIIHRDIKPGNILISTSGHVVLADFGFSKDFHRRPSASEITYQPYWQHLPGTVVTDDTSPVDPEDLVFVTNTRCGSPYEAAPEVYIGDWYSFPIDYWAAGVTLFWMLTGHPPWFEEDDDELCDQILFDPPAYLPEDLVDPIEREFIAQMLQKDPKNRVGIGSKMKHHPYFSGVDWKLHEEQKASVPWKPPQRAWEVLRPHNECISGADFEPGNPLEVVKMDDEQFFDFLSDRIKFGKLAPKPQIGLDECEEGPGGDEDGECVKTDKGYQCLGADDRVKRDSLLGHQGDAGGEGINGGVECGKHGDENTPGTIARTSDEMLQVVEEMVANIGCSRMRKQPKWPKPETRIREQHEGSAYKEDQRRLHCQRQPYPTLSPSWAQSCPNVPCTSSQPDPATLHSTPDSAARHTHAVSPIGLQQCNTSTESRVVMKCARIPNPKIQIASQTSAQGQVHGIDSETRCRQSHRGFTYNFASWSPSKFNTTKPLVIRNKIKAVRCSLRCPPPPELAMRQPIKQIWFDLVMEDAARTESTHQPSNHLEPATHDGRNDADVAFGSINGSATLVCSPQVTPTIAGVVSPPRPLANAAEVSRTPTTIDANYNVSSPNIATDPFTMLYPKTATSTSPRTLKTTIKQISPLSTFISFVPLLFQSPRKNATQYSIIEQVSPSHGCNAKIDPTIRQATVTQKRAMDTHSPRNTKAHLNGTEASKDSERRKTAISEATLNIAEIQFPTSEVAKMPQFLDSGKILQEEASIGRYIYRPTQRTVSPDLHAEPPSLYVRKSNDFVSQDISTSYTPPQPVLRKEAEQILVPSSIPSSSKISDAGTRVEDLRSCNSSDSESTRYSPRSNDPHFYGKFKEIFDFCDTPSASPSLLVTLSLALLDPPKPEATNIIPQFSDTSQDSPLMRPMMPFSAPQDSLSSPSPSPPLVTAAWEGITDERDYEFVEIPEDMNSLDIFPKENLAPRSSLSRHPSDITQLSNSERNKHKPLVSPNKMAEKVKAWGKKVLGRSRGNALYEWK